jgi:hypothetical protein
VVLTRPTLAPNFQRPGTRLGAGRASPGVHDQGRGLPANNRATLFNRANQERPWTKNIPDPATLDKNPVLLGLEMEAQTVNKAGPRRNYEGPDSRALRVIPGPTAFYTIGMNESSSFGQAPVSRRGRPPNEERLARRRVQRIKSYQRIQRLKKEQEATPRQADEADVQRSLGHSPSDGSATFSVGQP